MNKDVAEVTVEQKVFKHQIIFSDPAKFSQYMSMMRMFGYDVTATHAFNNKRIHNWADNASGRYIYVHDPDDVAPKFTISQKDIKKRLNHWFDLPTLYGEITYGYELGKKALTWFSGDERLAFASDAAVTVNRTEYQRAIANLTQARPTIKIIPLHKRTDFYETKISMPPSRPTLAPTLPETAIGPLIHTGVPDAEVMDDRGMEPAVATE
jgi:hypothetical protein